MVLSHDSFVKKFLGIITAFICITIAAGICHSKSSPRAASKQEDASVLPVSTACRGAGAWALLCDTAEVGKTFDYNKVGKTVTLQLVCGTSVTSSECGPAISCLLKSVRLSQLGMWLPSARLEELSESACLMVHKAIPQLDIKQ